MAAAVTSTIQIDVPDDDPLMDLFNVDADPPKLKEEELDKTKEATSGLANLNLRFVHLIPNFP